MSLADQESLYVYHDLIHFTPLQVETGDERQAGTSARVYVVLYGGKGGVESSGKVWLTDGRFERGRTDEFNIEVATMLSPLTKIDVGHDNSGPGPGWHCRQVRRYAPAFFSLVLKF